MTRRQWLAGTLLVGTLSTIAVGVPGAAATSRSEASAAAPVDVVVRAADVGTARAAVLAAGGSVTRDLPIIGGVAATLTADRVDQVRRAAGVLAVTPDGEVTLLGQASSTTNPLGYDPVNNVGSLYNTAKLIGAHDSYQAGYTGKGVDVAMLDTGVSPVLGLTSGNVVHGPDLSFESQDGDTTNYDTFGHGTNMAGIIVGREVAQADPGKYVDATRFVGIAPDARLISLKLAAHDGAVDVSQVIAAIDWVSQHKKAEGMNIRVLNLSFGTDGTQDSALDPLSYAAEQAWRRGIVVVAAAGNDGTSKVDLANPALNPHLIAVGAMDTMGTLKTSDDRLAAFSNRGTSKRKADFVAPGTKILSLRNPSGYLDEAYPGARVGSRFFRGGGSSQAAAVVSGAAALLLQRYPTATPNQVKDVFERTAKSLSTHSMNAGKGLVQVRAAQQTPLGTVSPKWAYGSGLGSLELARGSAHVTDCDDAGVCTDLVGEVDVMGRSWKPQEWAPKAANGTAWSGEGAWNGTNWTGTGFTDTGWTGRSWRGRSWTGSSWSGRSWTGRSWTGRSWRSTGWSSSTWTGRSWTGRSWTGSAWAGAGWE